MVIDYFTKWFIAKSLKKTTVRAISKFIYKKIICKHRCLEVLQNDQKMYFVNRVIIELIENLRLTLLVFILSFAKKWSCRKV